MYLGAIQYQIMDMCTYRMYFIDVKETHNELCKHFLSLYLSLSLKMFSTYITNNKLINFITSNTV